MEVWEKVEASALCYGCQTRAGKDPKTFDFICDGCVDTVISMRVKFEADLRLHQRKLDEYFFGIHTYTPAYK